MPSPYIGAYARVTPARLMPENGKRTRSEGWLAPARNRESAIDPIAIALVLVAAVVHASWNRVLHAEGDRVAAMAVAGLTVGVLLLPAVLISPPWEVWPLVVASAVAEVAYALSLSAAYKRGALSVAYPLGRGVAPLLITLGGWLLLSEPPDSGALVGAIALAVGLVLIAVVGSRAGQSAAVGFALLTGLTIAAYSVIDAAAVREVAPPGYLGAVLGIQGVLLTLLLRGDRVRLRQGLRTGVLIAVGLVSAYSLVLFAFQQAPAGRVSTLREASVLIGLMLSGERPSPVIWAGALLVLTGAFLAAS
jgi:drug/metabolite transporter (DMT)-like permease